MPTAESFAVDVLDAAGKKNGTVDLPAEVFAVQTNVPLIHQVVVGQLAAARQGTHQTKNRSAVRGGGKKPYKQKGTGNARQGSIRAPQYAGGGIVHGPQPRDYTKRTPKKMKAAALRGALSDRARLERVFVVSALVEGDKPSTKAAVAALNALSPRSHKLVVVNRDDQLTWLSVRNIPEVHVLTPGQLNTYDVLISDDVVFTKAALDTFLAGPPKGKSASAVGRASDVDQGAADLESTSTEEDAK
ncbi:50S ribosomal protein L4 [Spelaeicoccus albus]|uniref:Large ribosomal subunit protein uL4 n=1 Tax=Spelaeicoccus albus TaxID=1280376 RepID=A0A7Z0D5N8_9MICO|nr:50S ribosomal protein L4 [Spelaeicoccus albus]NYI69323.1 large subunit ribosomal protein L4 [Spelaeicoccus albus]